MPIRSKTSMGELNSTSRNETVHTSLPRSMTLFPVSISGGPLCSSLIPCQPSLHRYRLQLPDPAGIIFSLPGFRISVLRIDHPDRSPVASRHVFAVAFEGQHDRPFAPIGDGSRAFEIVEPRELQGGG